MQKITVRPNGTLDIEEVWDPELDPSLTQQQFKEECDINVIMDRAMRGLEITHLNRAQGLYTDLSSAPDYLEANLIVAKAETAFNSLPADIRTRFENNPSKLLAFLDDPKNRDEAVRLGIANPVVQSPSVTSPTQNQSPSQSNSPSPTSPNSPPTPQNIQQS